MELEVGAFQHDNERVDILFGKPVRKSRGRAIGTYDRAYLPAAYVGTLRRLHRIAEIRYAPMGGQPASSGGRSACQSHCRAKHSLGTRDSKAWRQRLGIGLVFRASRGV